MAQRKEKKKEHHEDPVVPPPPSEVVTSKKAIPEEQEQKDEPSLSFWTTEGERLRKAFIQAFQSKPGSSSKPSSSSLPTFSYCDGDDDYGGPMYSDYQTDLTELLKIDDKNPLAKDENDYHRPFSRALNVVQSATQILAEKRNPPPGDANKFLIAKELDFVVAVIRVLVATTAIATRAGGEEGAATRDHNTEENVSAFFEQSSWTISGCFMEFRLKSSRCRQSTLCRKAIATMERQLVKLGEAILTGFPPRPVGNDEGEKKKGGDAKPPPPAAAATTASRYFLTKSTAKELTVFLAGFFDSVCGMYHLPSSKVDPAQLVEDREREAKYALLAMQIYECASSAFPSRFESYPFYSCHAPIREAAIRLVKKRCEQVPASKQEIIPMYQLEDEVVEEEVDGGRNANRRAQSRPSPRRRRGGREVRTVPLLLFGAQLSRTFTDSDGRFWAGCSKTQFEIEDLALWKFGFYRLAVEMSTRPLPVEAARQRQEKKEREAAEEKKRLKEKEKTTPEDDDEDEDEDEEPQEVYLGPTRYRCQSNHTILEEWSMLLHEKSYLTDTAFRSHSKNRWGKRKDDESRYMQFDVWKRYQYLRHYASVERYFLNVKLMLASGVCRIDGGSGDDEELLGSPSGTLRGLTFDVRNEIISFVLGEFSMPKDFLRKRFKFPPPHAHRHSTTA